MEARLALARGPGRVYTDQNNSQGKRKTCVGSELRRTELCDGVAVGRQLLDKVSCALRELLLDLLTGSLGVFVRVCRCVPVRAPTEQQTEEEARGATVFSNTRRKGVMTRSTHENE